MLLGIGSPRSPAWTKEDDEILQTYYGKISNEELREKYLPNRTIKAIIGKAGSLGIRLPKSPVWTKEDDEILKKYYGRMSSKELQEKYLPNRTQPAIWIRARNLGIASKRGSTGVNEEKKPIQIPLTVHLHYYLPLIVPIPFLTGFRILGFLRVLLVHTLMQ